jgi:uncharacterized protein (DUF1778 family)
LTYKGKKRREKRKEIMAQTDTQINIMVSKELNFEIKMVALYSHVTKKDFILEAINEKIERFYAATGHSKAAANKE